jgi:hypothetical protein
MRYSTQVAIASLTFLLFGSVASKAESIVSQMNTPYSYKSGVAPYGDVRVAPSYGWWYDDKYHSFRDDQSKDEQLGDEQSEDDQSEDDD